MFFECSLIVPEKTESKLNFIYGELNKDHFVGNYNK